MAEPLFTVRTNLPDFKRQMRRFSHDLQHDIVRSAGNAAAQAFKEAVIANVDKLNKTQTRAAGRPPPGTLRRAIYVYRRRNSPHGLVQFRVGFRKGKARRGAQGGSQDAFYGRFLEAGWMPRGRGRAIVGSRAARARQRAQNRAAGAKFVQYPFIAPGFRAAQSAALQAFKRQMDIGIDKANRER